MAERQRGPRDGDDFMTWASAPGSSVQVYVVKYSGEPLSITASCCIDGRPYVNPSSHLFYEVLDHASLIVLADRLESVGHRDAEHVRLQAKAAMTMNLFDPDRSAVISECGRYRYRLDRAWDTTKHKVCWLMLNPSTADAEDDDPTLRRVIAYSQRWGFGSLVVVNLYACRATDPNDLPKGEEAIGPDADVHIARSLAESKRVICGWGRSVPKAIRRERETAVMRMIDESGNVPEALGFTRCGAPKHPLYLRADIEPQPINVSQTGKSGSP